MIRLPISRHLLRPPVVREKMIVVSERRGTHIIAGANYCSPSLLLFSPFIYFPVMLPADHLPCSRGGRRGGHAPALSSSPDSQAKHAVHSILGDTMACFFVFLSAVCFVSSLFSPLFFLRPSTNSWFFLQDMHRSTTQAVCKKGPSPVENRKGGKQTTKELLENGREHPSDRTHKKATV